MDSPSGANNGGGSTSTNSSRSSTSNNGSTPSLTGHELENKFTVIVDGDVIVLDDVRQQVMKERRRGRSV